MARAIGLLRNRYAPELHDWFAHLSLRARIAGTMIALVAVAGVVLSAWAYLADERLKRNITFDLLSEELTHFEQRMRVDRGAEPLRSARLSIYRSTDLAELPTAHCNAQAGRHAQGALAGPLARRAGPRRRFRTALHHIRRQHACDAGSHRDHRACARRRGDRGDRRPRRRDDLPTAGRARQCACQSTYADRPRRAARTDRRAVRGERTGADRAFDRCVHGAARRFRGARAVVYLDGQSRTAHAARSDARRGRIAGDAGGRPTGRGESARPHPARRARDDGVHRRVAGSFTRTTGGDRRRLRRQDRARSHRGGSAKRRAGQADRARDRSRRCAARIRSRKHGRDDDRQSRAQRRSAWRGRGSALSGARPGIDREQFRDAACRRPGECVAALHDASGRPRDGPLPRAAHLRAVRLGDPA